MGARGGHMSHLYDNPMLTFEKLKEVFKKAATGELEGTEKTDGQNISISYSVLRNEAVAIRNDDHAYKRGFNSDDLVAYMAAVNPAFKSLRTGKARKKKETPAHVRDAFAQAMETFEIFAQSVSPELQFEFFGQDADIFYNAEVMSASSRNVINYDVESLLIHRVGHEAYDEKEQDTVKMPREEAEEKATKLEAYLEEFYNSMSAKGMALQVGAVIQLQNLSTGAIYDEALLRLDKLISTNNLTDSNNIGQLIIENLEDIVKQHLPDLNIETRKLLYKRMYAEYYDLPVKGQGIDSRTIYKSADITPEVKKELKFLIDNSKKIIKEIVSPLEEIIHDFSVEMLRSLESAFILDNRKEVESLQKKVSSIIQVIENSDSEEAKEFLAQQMKKLKNVENIVTAAEGFVFDFDGHTYKFTGNFAPTNQLLGLQKFSRGDIPPDLFSGLEPLNEAFTHKGDEFLFIPGGFKPPHKGHLHLITKATEKKPKAKPYLVTGETPRDGVTLQQSMDVFRILLQDKSDLDLDDMSVITIPAGGLVILDEDGIPLKNKDGEIRYTSSPMQGIYNSALGLPKSSTVYIAYSTADKEHGGIGGSIKKARPDLVVENLPLEPLPGLKAGEKMSASDMRQALIDGNLKKFKTFLPEDSQDRAEYIFTRILGFEIKDGDEFEENHPEEEKPLGESFRAGDLYGLIDEVIEEMGSMSGGSIAFSPGRKKGGWAGAVPTEPAARKEDGKNKKKKKRKKKEKNLPEGMVEQVLNYLLNKEAAL